MVTLDGFCRIIKDVHFSSGLPVIADADTGFGEGEMCAKTVWEYFNAGAAGINKIMHFDNHQRKLRKLRQKIKFNIYNSLKF